MQSLVVTDRRGQAHVLETADGRTVMEIIREAGLDELLALCGGCLSCATCHVHVDPDQLASLPPMSRDESDLLDGSDYRDDRSRLSCQIAMSESLSGLRVTIAPEN